MSWNPLAMYQASLNHTWPCACSPPQRALRFKPFKRRGNVNRPVFLLFEQASAIAPSESMNGFLSFHLSFWEDLLIGITWKTLEDRLLSTHSSNLTPRVIRRSPWPQRPPKWISCVHGCQDKKGCLIQICLQVYRAIALLLFIAWTHETTWSSCGRRIKPWLIPSWTWSASRMMPAMFCEDDLIFFEIFYREIQCPSNQRKENSVTRPARAEGVGETELPFCG